LLLLRRLSHLSSSFFLCLQFCKTLAQKINEDTDSPSKDFTEFFVSHLFRAYLQICKEDSNKRSFIAELIYSHTCHDLSLRIRIVQDLKKYVSDENVLYSMLSFLVAQEESFNEEWFDVFLYYALVGICKPRPTVRTYSLKILNTISKFYAEGILDVTQKVKNLSTSDHWEVKAQCMLFACNILRYLRNYSYLLKSSKDEAGDKDSQPNNRGGIAAKEVNIDRNYAKQLISHNIDIMNNCFGPNVPKSVQKLGLFETQDILNDFKSLYRLYVETFLTMDPDVRSIILGRDESLKNEEIYFSLGSSSENYKVKSNPEFFDKISIARALADYLIENDFESLEEIHIDLLVYVIDQGMDSRNHESWLKIFSKLKEYLFIAICDHELYEQALNVLYLFFTAEQLKFQIYEV